MAHRGSITAALGLFGIWHLSRVRQEFGGDMTAALVLGEVAHHNISAMLTAGRRMDPHARPFSLPAEQAMLPCNVHSIALACGLPRETVRRKVASLLERGWLRRSGRGDLFVTDVPVARFEEFNVEFARRIFETHDWLVSIVEAPQEAVARPRPAAGGPRSGAARHAYFFTTSRSELSTAARKSCCGSALQLLSRAAPNAAPASFVSGKVCPRDSSR